MSTFVDEAQVHARAGDGGAGAVSVRREAYVPRGGPDGGNGGGGGDVWLVASRGVASLLGFRDHPHRRAGDGVHGRGKKLDGRRGADVEVPVPVGTVVRLGGEALVDLSAEGDRFLAAAGGRGGRGNASFLSNARRAPSFAEQGERGEERWLDLELKLMADVALVGFPNAGKSTLLSVVSAAKPKIADYPFTTLEPHLGVVRVGDGSDTQELVMADIPGLIEGASEGRGLGHKFLRHLERASVLLVMLDLSPAATAPAPLQLDILLAELARHHPDLIRRPRVVVGSKADAAIPGQGATGRDVPERQDVPGWRRVSSVTREGLKPLLHDLASLVATGRAEAGAVRGDLPLEPVVHRIAPSGFEVERRDGGGFAVVGRAAERAVALSDLTDAGAAEYAFGRLRRMGVDRALARAGARDGDDVDIGGLHFTYTRDGPAPGVRRRASRR
ncbi:MAG: GTPase ObgE [Acidimicrobiales bacterium]